LKKFNIDIVGRIGNMIIEDTGDFRFSNFFKKPASPTEWQVDNLIKKVDITQQNNIIGDKIDIRGEPVGPSTRYLDTYSKVPHMYQEPEPFPLSPDKNNIAALSRQPLRFGYSILSDIQTIGNYYSKLQVTPYFYALDLQDGSVTPVDLYMSVDGGYKIINKHNGVYTGWNPSSVFNHEATLDWLSEAGRRNYSSLEYTNTEDVTAYAYLTGSDTTTGRAASPIGDSYIYGNAQFMELTGRNRTYIGGTTTYGWDKNPGNALSPSLYAQQGQRWHYSYSLPSSTVAIEAGKSFTQENIDAIRVNTKVIVLAADIKAVGDTYVLEYRVDNGYVDIAETSWSLSKIPYPVIAVYSSTKSSADDLDVFGTH
jgi:hypothetical protein